MFQFLDSRLSSKYRFIRHSWCYELSDVGNHFWLTQFAGPCFYSRNAFLGQFDLITGLEEKNGYQCDSSIQDFKIFPRGACPRTPLDGRAFGVPFKTHFTKGPCFPDPGPSINPLPILNKKMNGKIVVRSLLAQLMSCKKYMLY